MRIFKDAVQNMKIFSFNEKLMLIDLKGNGNIQYAYITILIYKYQPTNFYYDTFKILSMAYFFIRLSSK